MNAVNVAQQFPVTSQHDFSQLTQWPKAHSSRMGVVVSVMFVVVIGLPGVIFAAGQSSSTGMVRGAAATTEIAESPAIKSILLLPAITTLDVRGNRQLAAVAIHEGGGTDVTSLAKWTSSNESIAIVSTSGLVTGLTAGQVTITVTMSEVSQSRRITITESK
jgi:hypothetical protein